MGKRDDLIERFDRETERMGVRIRDADQFKVSENVFDDITLLSLYRLVHKKKIKEIGGSISTGKEANVFYGEGEEMPIAIKIYRIQSANFRSMSEYIIGDPRFSSVKKSKKDLIFAWTKKEYSNLARALDAGLRVPIPIHFDRNILIMEFMGEDEIAYPQLRLARPDDYQAVYDEITAAMKTLFNEAELVHADLSEFNILWDGEHPIIIDIGQAVTPNHPKAIKFLVRDIKNINRYFDKRCTIRDEEELFRDIVGEHRMQI
ncbi:serine protein kinase RIO [Methanogenium marinum]|uniref:non-specific serine/threonine protein kinase n=1 Tax=Methanogenium marinum TaxID=348610 RepID=A0A9Q4PW94_9EURY|nr:serine protein kinase RIO [Methanogenium marinum]MDE4908409.1 serine protein kinase RIO [Methanogenium marinum]